MKKLVKLLLTLVIAVGTMFTSVLTTKAEARQISLGNATQVQGRYINGKYFSYKVTTDGKYLYCLNIHKNTATNTTASLVENSTLVDGGITYILENGYPTKSITGDKDKDYYITQIAVWWYLDDVKGGNNLEDGIKNDSYYPSSTRDPQDLRKYVKSLVVEAKKHQNDKVKNTELKLNTNDTKLVLNGSNFESSEIKATTSNISTYKVTLTGAPNGTVIVKNGAESKYTGTFNLNVNESFKIKVPATVIGGQNTTIKVSAEAQGNDQYFAHEFKPADGSMQNVALLEIFKSSKAESSLDLTVSSSKVSVLKIDSVTKQPVSGAVLKLSKKEGTNLVYITQWTSDINEHIIYNLADGDYIIEETSAPKGYILNKNVTKFSITKEKKSFVIKIENAPKKVVVNITKVDEETNAPLAGAILVVKRNGQVVERFETTAESTVFTDLEDGEYTVEEEKAPNGYIKSDDVIKFTVDENHLSHQIIFKNAKSVDVPDTASVSSTIMLILGIVITGLGIGYVYKNAKKAK